MRISDIRIWTVLLLCGMVPTVPVHAQEAVDVVETEADGTADEPLPWIDDLAEGTRKALAERKPVLVRVGAVWCPSCRELEKEILGADVQSELARWIPVYLDADRMPPAGSLQVAAVPALRIRTATGRIVASHDGLRPADELVAWLRKHHDAAVPAPDDVLLDTGRPDALAVIRLVRQFSARETAIRETAIRRLLPYPDAARKAVVKTFREGGLGARLAALELLHDWGAPIDGMDPWRPDTISDQRLADLEAWDPTEATDDPTETEDTELSKEELLAARGQIDRMLRVDPAETEAIQQRLARFGEALLPELVDRLAEATEDEDRCRLLTMRYLLVAGDSLTLRWPGGPARLASADSRERAKAAEELAGLATAEDQPLLLELFSDPDPLVREISLRGLQELGGKRATDALIRLLDDPSPNVRAAVLKQLAETPSPALVPKVAEYVKTEEDADLVVHAIRFLRAAGAKKSAEALIALLKHDSWQVRAEAAEAIGSGSLGSVYSLTTYGLDGEDQSAAMMADAYAALIELLDDPDAFVVSRAVTGLSNADMEIAVDPLVKAAETHPELASSIIEILSNGENMRPKALPHMRRFATHDDAAIRAAAIEGLCRLAPLSMREEMIAALADTDSQVRIAAGNALFNVLESHRSEAADRMSEGRLGGNEGIGLPPPMAMDVPSVTRALTRGAVRFLLGPQEARPEEPENQPDESEGRLEEPEADPNDENADNDEDSGPHPWDHWLTDYYAGTGRPDWTADTIEPLRAMLGSEAFEERLVAARALVPLGMAEEAVPVMRALLESRPELLEKAGQILPWLVGTERLKLFDVLCPLCKGDDQFDFLLAGMSEVRDRRAVDRYWTLLAEEGISLRRANALRRALRVSYLGGAFHWGRSEDASPAERRKLATAAKPRAIDGPQPQRLAALTLLMAAAPEEAAEVARGIIDSPDADAQMKGDALQVLLLSQTSRLAANRLAIESLSGETDAPRRKVAMAVLVGEPHRLRMLRETFDLPDLDNDLYVVSSSSGKPIIPEPPLGLKAEHVRPLIDEEDPLLAAQAGYLLALLEEPAGLPPLLRYWRRQENADERLDRLAYRAIAILNDSSRVADLRRIYERLDEYDVSEFYWTIRIMSGSEVLRLRARIRDEVGMDRLRW